MASYVGDYLANGAVGQLVEDSFNDTVNGLNGSITGHFEVNDKDIAFLNAGDHLVETFDVVISDNHGGSTTQTVTVTITGAQNQPVAADDDYSILHGHQLTVNALSGVLANDTEPDQNGLTAAVATGPSHGSLSLNIDGSFIYTPDAHYYGDDTFTYTATDQTLSATGTVTIHVTDQAPVAHDETFSDLHGQTIQPTSGTGPSAGRRQRPGRRYADDGVGERSGPSHGTLSFGVVNPDGSFTYTANNGYVGDDSFQYTVTDGAITTRQTATIHVTDQAPVAHDETFSDLHGQTIQPTSGTGGTGLLAGDSDPDGDTLTTALVNGSGPSHGTLSFGVVNPDGSFTYTANNGYVGDDSFHYTVTDGAITTTQTATIHVTDQAPVAHDETFSDLHGQTIQPTSGTGGTGLLAGDSDPDGDTLTTALVNGSGPSHGTLSFGVVNPDGSFTYTANNGYVGDDSFQYTVTDGAITTTQTATIHVTDQAPVAHDETFSDLHGQTIQPTSGTGGTGLLAGDSDPDGDTLTTALVNGSGPSHGTLSFGVVNPDGSFTYTANNGYVGDDSFQYTVTDGAITTTQTATIHVTDQAPVAVDDFYSTDENTQLSTTDGIGGTGVLHNDSDPDAADSLTVSLLHGAAARHVIPEHAQPAWLVQLQPQYQLCW